MSFSMRLTTVKSKLLVVFLLVVFAGCQNSIKRDIIYGFWETELNPVKAIYDVNDPNKVTSYVITSRKDHTGWYISNRVMKKAFSIEIK